MKSIWLVIFVISLFSSCKKDESPAISPNADQTPSPSPAPLSPTPTPNAVVLYKESFLMDDHQWKVDSTSNYILKYYQSHYSLKSNKIKNLLFSTAPYGNIDFPYSVQVDGIIQVENLKKVGYLGVIFNLIDTNNYSSFEIGSDGSYFIWNFNKGKYTYLGYASYNQEVKTTSGAKNTLKVTQNASTIDFQINTVYIKTISLAMLKSAIQVGVSVDTDSALFTPTTNLFNNFIISKNN
jgi:hypothetical protein